MRNGSTFQRRGGPLTFLLIFTFVFRKVAYHSSFIRCHCALFGDISQPCLRRLLGTDLPFRPLSTPSHFYILPISAWLLTQYPRPQHPQPAFLPPEFRSQQRVLPFVLPRVCFSPLCFIISATAAAPNSAFSNNTASVSLSRKQVLRTLAGGWGCVALQMARNGGEHGFHSPPLL